MAEIDNTARVSFVFRPSPWTLPVQVLRHKHCGEWEHKKPVYIGQIVFCPYCGRELHAEPVFDEKETPNV